MKLNHRFMPRYSAIAIATAFELMLATSAVAANKPEASTKAEPVNHYGNSLNTSLNTTNSPCGRVEVGPMVRVPVGKSTVLKPQAPVTRILLGNPENAQAARPSETAKPDANGNN